MVASGGTAAAAVLLVTAVLLSWPTGGGATKVCIVGGGIAGSSAAHFLKQYTCAAQPSTLCIDDILVLERSGKPGGRMATVSIAGDTFEAGASIIHPQNLHAVEFARLLGLRRRNSSEDGDSSIGIWDGSMFVFRTLHPPSPGSSAVCRWIHSLLNSLMVFKRYGLSLLRMNSFVKKTVKSFLKYYEGMETRPVFETVEEMLKWTGLYHLTHETLQEKLTDVGLSQLMISELVTVITRINYGQNVSISGLAGAVSLAGSDPGLWSVDGGNWQLAAGLLKHTNATVHFHEEVSSISYTGSYYVLKSLSGNQYSCEVAVLATPLDELNISIALPISVPNRRLQHTYATFVRGLLNHEYFGMQSSSEVPVLIGTLELSDIPFSSISVLRSYSEDDKAYKIFSRTPISDNLLDQIFSTRKDTIVINWPAYPHFRAPEVFAPIILDGLNLYYINSFENAASTIETSAVAAENVARLIISRLSNSSHIPLLKRAASGEGILHSDL